MKRKCDNCGKPATHHSVEIIKGEKIEKHLCDSCAADEGLAGSGVALDAGEPTRTGQGFIHRISLSGREARLAELRGSIDPHRTARSLETLTDMADSFSNLFPGTRAERQTAR